jgi:histone-lysine N-methyltransferase SETD7
MWLGDADGGVLRGEWRQGALTGRVRISYNDRRSIECKYVDGEHARNSPYVECFRGRTTFVGTFIDERQKSGIKYNLEDSTTTEGLHVDDELIDEGTFTFPDGSALKGRFENGLAKAVHFVAEGGHASAQTYGADVSTTARLALHPMRADPYETRTVYVAASTEVGGGEGLFAKRDLPHGRVCAFYNGVRITHADERRRDWRLNCNSISLNDEWCVDVPAPFDSTSRYCAALGHKVNTCLTDDGVVDQVACVCVSALAE